MAVYMNADRDTIRLFTSDIALPLTWPPEKSNDMVGIATDVVSCHSKSSSQSQF